MRTTDLFNFNRSSRRLNESLHKTFGARINFESFDTPKLEDARNKLRTQIHTARTSSGFNETVENEALTKAQFMHDAIVAELADREEHIVDTSVDEGGASMPDDQYLSIPADQTKLSIGQQMAQDGITYSPDKEDELIGLMSQYMKKAGMSSKQIRYYLSYDEDFIPDQLSDLPRQGVAEGLSKRDQQDVAAIEAAIERLQAQLKQPNADRDAIQQSIAHEKKRLELYPQGVAEGDRPFRGVGGAFNRGDDERHDLDPTEWYIVKDGKMFKTSVYPNQVQLAIAQGYSRTREEAKAKAEQQGVGEEAPPTAKGERMVKHIKKGYADDGKLTDKEKSIAYATAWKAHNNESIEQTGDDMRNLREGEIQQASAIVTAKTMVDRVGRWIEELSGMENDTLLQLGDSIRDEMGQEQAKAFIEAVAPAIQQALETLKGTRDTLSTGVRSLASGEQPMDMLGAEPAAPGGEMDAAGPDAMNDMSAAEPAAGDEFAAAEPAAGGMETAGREQRESIDRQSRLMKILAG